MRKERDVIRKRKSKRKIDIEIDDELRHQTYRRVEDRDMYSKRD